jgi:hypothetical protein
VRQDVTNIRSNPVLRCRLDDGIPEREKEMTGTENTNEELSKATFWRVVFQIDAPPPNVVGLDLRGPNIVGHSSLTTEERPDLDLSPYGASVNGISRRHAVLLPQDDGVFLIDLSSTNGTWVNGEFLEPGSKHKLRRDDALELGHLQMIVRVVEQVVVTYDQGFGTTVSRSKPQ